MVMLFFKKARVQAQASTKMPNAKYTTKSVDSKAPSKPSAAAPEPATPTRHRGKLAEWFKSIQAFDKMKRLFKKQKRGKEETLEKSEPEKEEVPQAVSVDVKDITDEDILRLLELIKTCPGLPPAVAEAVIANLHELVASIPAADLDEIDQCVDLLTSNALLTPDQEPANWVRFPGRGPNFELLEKIGLENYLKHRESVVAEAAARGERLNLVQGTDVGAYLKNILKRVPGGTITKSLRDLIMAIAVVREDGSLIIPIHARPLLSAILRVTAPRAHILRQIVRLSTAIIRTANVGAKQLAVVLPAIDVNAGAVVVLSDDFETNMKAKKALQEDLDRWNGVWAMVVVHFEGLVGGMENFTVRFQRTCPLASSSTMVEEPAALSILERFPVELAREITLRIHPSTFPKLLRCSRTIHTTFNVDKTDTSFAWAHLSMHYRFIADAVESGNGLHDLGSAHVEIIRELPFTELPLAYALVFISSTLKARFFFQILIPRRFRIARRPWRAGGGFEIPLRESLPRKFVDWWANIIKEALCLDLITSRYGPRVSYFAVWLGSADLLELAIAKLLLRLPTDEAVKNSIFKGTFPKHKKRLRAILTRALFDAIGTKNYALVERILQHPLTDRDAVIEGYTVFSAALWSSAGDEYEASFARHAMLHVLLENGCNANLRDKMGKTPLMHVSEFRSIADFRLLLHSGAQPSYRDNREFNALHVVASDCFYKGAKAILEYLSSDVKELQRCLNYQSFYVMTPLMIAINRCSLRLVQLFLEHGADIMVADYMGRAAIDYALQPKLRGHPGSILIADALFERLAEIKDDCDEKFIKAIVRKLRRTDPELLPLMERFGELKVEVEAVMAEEPVADDDVKSEFDVGHETDSEGSQGNADPERFDCELYSLDSYEGSDDGSDGDSDGDSWSTID
ncbi:hypothetical protein HDU96_003537 [Phlyctochytrium bullatum]|nr:hypothetical protein HDU96_003537 [Phlyctochytrium bullatum]